MNDIELRQELRRNDFVTHLGSKKIQGGITTVYFKCLQKIFKTSPVKSNFVRFIAFLDPIIISSK